MFIRIVYVYTRTTLYYVSFIVTVHLYNKCFVFYVNSDVILTCGQLQVVSCSYTIVHFANNVVTLWSIIALEYYSHICM